MFDPEGMKIESIHLVLGGSAAGTLKAIFSGEPGQRVVALDDNLSMGPLLHFDTPEGVAERGRWIKRLFNTIGAESAFDEILNGIGLPVLNALNDVQSRFVSWCGPNADEQLLLRAVMAKLRGKAIEIVDVGRLQTGGHRPKAVAECKPDALRQALSEAWTPGDQEIQGLGQQWHQQLLRTGTLRVYREGRIIEVPEDHFDARILAEVPPEFGSAAKVVGSVLGQSEDVIGDAFINYRLRKMVGAGTVQALNSDGHLMSMKVRKPS